MRFEDIRDAESMIYHLYSDWYIASSFRVVRE